MPHYSIIRTPYAVAAYTGDEILSLERHGDSYGLRDIDLLFNAESGNLKIDINAQTSALERIHIRWNSSAFAGCRLLGDHWERGYGDLEWRTIIPERVMPWCFLAYDGKRTSGYGVKTGASSFCFWRVDSSGVSLWLDIRSGGVGVELGGRTLRAAEVTNIEGEADESPFQTARRFYRLLCDAPAPVSAPIYGGNNWYFAYGDSSRDDILRDTDIIASLSPSGPNRPFMTIDDGWQPESNLKGDAAGGPWDRGNKRFPDMKRLADEIQYRGVRAGIWLRPLKAAPNLSDSLLIHKPSGGRILDPTIDENLENIAADFSLIRSWGYELIKHDFSTWDLLGRWGKDMGSELTSGGWSFSKRTKTTAEIILDFYKAIRAGAHDAIIIGCNTVGHLCAGLFEVQRTGDDTSGQDWERTRRMGINTLAFRAAQHDAFFQVDADCVGVTSLVPWDLNKNWLDLLSKSGTPLFASIEPNALGPQQKAALKEAFSIASQRQPLVEPLDWLDTTCPTDWRLGEKVVHYNWYPESGISAVAGV